MQFQNLQVDWQQLPQASATEMKPIEKAYLKVLCIAWGIFYLLALVAIIIAITFIDPAPTLFWKGMIFISFGLITIVTFVIIMQSFKRKAYAVREKDIIYRTGWIFQKLHIIPFNRVQHCVVQSGPIERKFHLAAISIFTAATHVHDISIRGLKPDDAELLKTYIMQQIQPLTNE
jgi:membrane protein YdbS with pleckstrin-like domain